MRQSWLVFVLTESSEGSGCVMLVYRVNADNWPAVVLVHSGRRIPNVFGRLTGGIIKWAEPMTDAEASSLTGTGWFAYKEPNRDVPTVLMEQLFIPHSAGLLGIVVIDSFLAIWSDTERIETLLAMVPSVCTVFSPRAD